MKKVSLSTSILNSRFKRNRTWVLKAIDSFEGKNITITLEREKSKRSLQQNKYYWGVVIPLLKKGLLDATGEIYNSEEIHYQLLLPKFGRSTEIVNKNTGEVTLINIGSSEMSKTEFADYINEIQRFGAEFLQIDIPSPGEELQLFK
ncbi:hypothetical protein GNY06_02945 [Elizabethkingia argentiflava]|uniref:Uncharacterized protein n=1 Tax=Elizabethkingia argenteiflava TaxID=2681556 RepID=A0A845PWA8_9FLAO|nr:recombination protein NinB [Elizabethkingia argenteiflava]NAW50390.1 hypothetical protein [Elizabethkingia argenteiflava]